MGPEDDRILTLGNGAKNNPLPPTTIRAVSASAILGSQTFQMAFLLGPFGSDLSFPKTYILILTSFFLHSYSFVSAYSKRAF